MSDLLAMVEAMDDHDKAVACRVLDAVSQPLQVRQIEAVLRSHGVAKTRAAKLANTLKGFHVLAMLGPERG